MGKKLISDDQMEKISGGAVPLTAGILPSTAGAMIKSGSGPVAAPKTMTPVAGRVVVTKGVVTPTITPTKG